MPFLPGHEAPRRRMVGFVLAALSLAAIAALTLTPQPPSDDDPFGHACLVCGQIGGADVIANVMLFLPFGFGLGLAGLSWRRATLASAALSIGIELSQLLVVAGRFATLSDVVTNTTGGAIAAVLAASIHLWLRPPPRVAARLAVGAAACFAGALAFGAWALGRPGDDAVVASRLDAVPVETHHGYFRGAITHVALADLVADHRGLGPVTVAAPARRAVSVQIQATGWDSRPTLVPMLYVYRPSDGTPWLVLGQQGRSVVLEGGLRGQRLRLRQPKLTVPRAVGRGRSWLMSPFTVGADVSGDRLTLTYYQSGVSRASTIRLSPTLGWALLSPFPAADSALAALASAIWVAGLAFPLGYWLRWVARGRRRAELSAAAGMLGTFVVGLVVVPATAGFATARPWEWIATVGGAVVGAVGAEVMRRIR